MESLVSQPRRSEDCHTTIETQILLHIYYASSSLLHLFLYRCHRHIPTCLRHHIYWEPIQTLRQNNNSLNSKVHNHLQKSVQVLYHGQFELSHILTIIKNQQYLNLELCTRKPQGLCENLKQSPNSYIRLLRYNNYGILNSTSP